MHKPFPFTVAYLAKNIQHEKTGIVLAKNEKEAVNYLCGHFQGLFDDVVTVIGVKPHDFDQDSPAVVNFVMVPRDAKTHVCNVVATDTDTNQVFQLLMFANTLEELEIKFLDFEKQLPNNSFKKSFEILGDHTAWLNKKFDKVVLTPVLKPFPLKLAFTDGETASEEVGIVLAEDLEDAEERLDAVFPAMYGTENQVLDVEPFEIGEDPIHIHFVVTEDGNPSYLIVEGAYTHEVNEDKILGKHFCIFATTNKDIVFAIRKFGPKFGSGGLENEGHLKTGRINRTFDMVILD